MHVEIPKMFRYLLLDLDIEPQNLAISKVFKPQNLAISKVFPGIQLFLALFLALFLDPGRACHLYI